MAALSPKMITFVSEYVIDNNATQAAIRAGYSRHTAQEQSSRLLSKVLIQEAVEKLRAAAAKRNNVTLDEITRMHRKAFDVAYAQGQSSAMSGAAQNLAKLHGLIVDKQEQVSEIQVNIIKGFL
jgi:phage terminase small subunit